MRAKFTVGLIVIWAFSAGMAAAQNAVFPATPLTRAENQFAFDLYGLLSQRSGNLVFSPFGAANVLDMVYLGAKGATAEELANVLHLSELSTVDLPSAPALVQSVLERRLFTSQYKMPNAPIVELPGGFQFEDTDALWVAKGERLKPDYQARIKSAFNGDLLSADFANAPGAAAQINNWVSSKTHGRITDLISAAAINPRMRIMLTDVVYFKAGWATDFDVSESKSGMFHVAPGHDVKVRMMHATGKYMITRGDGMKMLQIPYLYDDASLLIILPDKPDGLSSVEAELSSQELNFWLEYAQQFNVTMSIPAFTTGSTLDLSPNLQALGMKRAFAPSQADLGLIADAGSSPIYVGNVVQKAFIDVQEKGTEAAAATDMAINSAGIEPPMEDVTFVADHPFIYVIRANRSGDILFMGRVENPAQHGM